VATTPPAVARAEDEARAAVAREQEVSGATLSPRTIAVAPFATSLADTTLVPLGFALADLLQSDLAVSSRLTLVERLDLQARLRELRLVEGGVVDSATAPRVGRTIGAGRLVVGGLADLPGARPSGAPAGQGELLVTVRLADVATGALLTGLDARAPVARIIDAEKSLALRLFDLLGVALTPAERAEVERRPTDNVAALVAYGRGVRDEMAGRYAEAARHFREAARLDPRFRQAAARLRSTQRLFLGATAMMSPADRATWLTTERTSGTFTSPLGGGARPGTPTDPAFPVDIVRVGVVVIIP
jgi:hypothetical protein